MKADNVAVRETNGVFVAYYIGDDAPLLNAVGGTRESAIGALYHEWKRFHSIINASRECNPGVAYGC
ncbi:hypothetical protein ACFQGT_09880 [Natrialbaceae archaeon GCM10025810]|uniref:hypothetical protein n=1 Tax=Halovalidus salilacus TaxID=3075124 RepID=UPI003617D373